MENSALFLLGMRFVLGVGGEVRRFYLLVCASQTYESNIHRYSSMRYLLLGKRVAAFFKMLSPTPLSCGSVQVLTAAL